MLLLNLMVDFSQVGDQLLLLGVFSKHTWHFLFQRADDVRLHLDTMTEMRQTQILLNWASVAELDYTESNETDRLNKKSKHEHLNQMLSDETQKKCLFG